MTPWTAARQASLSITSSWSPLRLMPIESVMPSDLSSSVVPFSSHLQSFPVSGSFPMSQFFASGGQSNGVSALASVLPVDIQDWFPVFKFYCSGFCHTLTWISHGSTCVPHPNPPSRLPLHPIPLGLPSAPALSTYLMHPTSAGDLFHPW